MKIVISLGGSLLTRSLTSQNFGKYAKILKKLKEEGHKIVVVCGGGKTCRMYQKIAKGFDANDITLDKIGIIATHLNAMTLIGCLGKDAYPKVLRKVKEVKRLLNDKILVCGGDLPGHSTDYDAVLFAIAIKANLLINATNVDGVYSEDPRKNPKAKKFKKLSYDKFLKIVSKISQAPGEHRLFDIDAAKLIKKHRIKTIIIDGKDPREILRAIENKHNGTEIG